MYSTTLAVRAHHIATVDLYTGVASLISNSHLWEAILYYAAALLKDRYGDDYMVPKVTKSKVSMFRFQSKVETEIVALHSDLYPEPLSAEDQMAQMMSESAAKGLPEEVRAAYEGVDPQEVKEGVRNEHSSLGEPDGTLAERNREL